MGRFWYFDVSKVAGEKNLTFQGFAKIEDWLQSGSIGMPESCLGAVEHICQCLLVSVYVFFVFGFLKGCFN